MVSAYEGILLQHRSILLDRLTHENSTTMKSLGLSTAVIVRTLNLSRQLFLVLDSREIVNCH